MQKRKEERQREGQLQVERDQQAENLRVGDSSSCSCSLRSLLTVCSTATGQGDGGRAEVGVRSPRHWEPTAADHGGASQCPSPQRPGLAALQHALHPGLYPRPRCCPQPGLSPPAAQQHHLSAGRGIQSAAPTNTRHLLSVP